jgi:hypothetical protein
MKQKSMQASGRSPIKKAEQSKLLCLIAFGLPCCCFIPGLLRLHI